MLNPDASQDANNTWSTQGSNKENSCENTSGKFDTWQRLKKQATADVNVASSAIDRSAEEAQVEKALSPAEKFHQAKAETAEKKAAISGKAQRRVLQEEKEDVPDITSRTQQFE